MLQLLHEDHSLACFYVYSQYSRMQLSEPGHREENGIVESFKMAAKGIKTRALIDRQDNQLCRRSKKSRRVGWKDIRLGTEKTIECASEPANATIERRLENEWSSTDTHRWSCGLIERIDDDGNMTRGWGNSADAHPTLHQCMAIFHFFSLDLCPWTQVFELSKSNGFN